MIVILGSCVRGDDGREGVRSCVRQPTRASRATRVALAALAVLAGGAVAGCDLSSSLDIETPEHVPAPVLRSVLTAGEPVLARISVSRDPYAASDLRFADRPTQIDAVVTLWRDGVLIEELRPRPRTCYQSRASSCNTETGRTETTTSGPFECGGHRGAVPIEAGARYTLRAEVPGMPPAQATVDVPDYPAVSGGLSFNLSDPPGPGHRYGVELQGEFDRYSTSVCAIGGRRDTTVVLGTIAAYGRPFTTDDTVLRTAARETGASIPFAAFPDDAFDGRTRTFALAPDRRTVHSGDTGGARVRVSALSAVLYDAYVLVQFDLDENPFAEPTDLPSNVEGGYGRVGAVATTELRIPGPNG